MNVIELQHRMSLHQHHDYHALQFAKEQAAVLLLCTAAHVKGVLKGFKKRATGSHVWQKSSKGKGKGYTAISASEGS